MKISPKERHLSREFSLQALYQWQLGGENLADIEVQYLTQHADRKFDREYFKTLLHKIPEMISTLDEAIEPYLDRPLVEVTTIELVILRIAAFEFIHQADVPYKVVINEAIELAKRFGAEESHKFINGVVDKAARKLRYVEIQGSA